MPQPPADLIVVNARIWTGEDALTGTPRMIAVRGSRIVAVGENQEADPLTGPDTVVVDARDRRLIPGITDSHLHLIGGGLQLSLLNLRAAPDREAFVRSVADAARRAKPGEWILGGRWSTDSWARPQWPRKEWVDPVTGDVPLFLTRMDGHGGLANSAALKLAGIDASGPPDPEGGEI